MTFACSYRLPVHNEERGTRKALKRRYFLISFKQNYCLLYLDKEESCLSNDAHGCATLWHVPTSLCQVTQDSRLKKHFYVSHRSTMLTFLLDEAEQMRSLARRMLRTAVFLFY